MITRYKRISSVLSRPLRNLSSHPKADKQDSSVHDDASIIQWLTSPSPHPPPHITTRLHFTPSTSSSPITFTTTTTHPLTLQQSIKASTLLLSPLQSSPSPLLRSPPTLTPLTVEFSSPNIAKPLHMGHLRSTLTGSYVRNLAEFAGHKCRSTCFLGDWGRQFGVLHAGVIDKMGEIGAGDFETFVNGLTLQELLHIYVYATNKCVQDQEFNAKALNLSATLESSFGSESEGNYLWSHTRSITVDHLKSCYSDLGIRFDEFEGESTYNRDSSHTVEALKLLEQMNLSYQHEDGTLRVQIEPEKSVVLLKRDNSSVYLLRDIACALNRSALHPSNKFVYVVDQGQSDHFRNLFKVLVDLEASTQCQGPLPFTSTHTFIPFGKVQGMSTRSGNFVLLSEVIEQGTDLMHESRKRSKNARNVHDVEVSKGLAVSGLVVNALKVRRNKAYSFDWGEALRSNGNSGVALQYTVARLGSLVRRVGGIGEFSGVEDKLEVLFKSGRKEVLDLVICLMNFEDTFWRSYTSVEPCILVTYSFNLSDKISKALSVVNIMKENDRDLANAALWLFNVSRHTLERCMGVLGVRIVGGF